MAVTLTPDAAALLEAYTLQGKVSAAEKGVADAQVAYQVAVEKAEKTRAESKAKADKSREDAYAKADASFAKERDSASDGPKKAQAEVEKAKQALAEAEAELLEKYGMALPKVGQVASRRTAI